MNSMFLNLMPQIHSAMFDEFLSIADNQKEITFYLRRLLIAYSPGCSDAEMMIRLTVGVVVWRIRVFTNRFQDKLWHRQFLHTL